LGGEDRRSERGTRNVSGKAKTTVSSIGEEKKETASTLRERCSRFIWGGVRKGTRCIILEEKETIVKEEDGAPTPERIGF